MIELGKNMEKGLVSVIIPNYNSEAYLREMIEDMLNQTYKNWELIFVDDKSSDSSPLIISEYARQDKRIKLLRRNDGDKGACQRRNQGLGEARGEFIIFLDSDDRIPPYSLESRIKEMESNPDVDFIVSPAISFSKKPFDIQTLALGMPWFNDDLSMFLKRFRLPFAVWTNSYRSSFLKNKEIRWDERLSSMQDSDFNIQCILAGAKYRYSKDQRPAYYWRTGGNPASITKGIKSNKELDSQLYFYRKQYDLFKNTKYKKDVDRFGLTLLNRFALYQYGKMPGELFTKSGRKSKFKILRELYSKNLFAKFWVGINLIASPVSILDEYFFLIRNRLKCRQYIRLQTPAKR